MKLIYSKINPNLLLHIIVTRQDFTQPRIDITDPCNFLQVALMHVNEGRIFKPHRHIERDVTFKTTKAQESWVVIRGLIRADLYDIDDKLLTSEIIAGGEGMITLNGGHTFQSLEDHTFIYEFKSVPYEGQAKDKIFI